MNSALPVDARYFPFGQKITTMRPVQHEAATELTNVIQNGSRRAVICGPPGCGKSAIGMMLSGYMRATDRRTTYTSPLNTLVDQLGNSFQDIRTLKGREHYSCVVSNMLGGDCTCAEGLCQIGVCATLSMRTVKQAGQVLTGNKKLTMTPIKRMCSKCEYRYTAECMCSACEFTLAKNEFMEAWTGNTNFTMFRLGIRYSNCVIIDECEMTEPFLRMELGVTIDDGWPESTPWTEYIKMIGDLVQRKLRTVDGINGQLRALGNSDNPVSMYEYEQLMKEKTKLDREIGKLNFVIRDWDKNGEPWVGVPETYTLAGKEHKRLRFEPITVNRFIDNMFRDDQFVLFMSATPIIPEGWDFIELPSPFPKEIRPWVYDPIGKMTLNERDKTIPKLADYIIKLQKKRPGKLLVHCVSYKIARDIAECLYDRGITHITLQNTRDAIEGMDGLDAVTRSRAVSNFIGAGNTNQIFLSVNMESGVDLWQPEFRTQIIAKVPFANPVDPVVIAKKQHIKNADSILSQETANKIVQAYGRINRNADKETLTIITDKSFSYFYQQHRRQFRRYFTEAEVRRWKA